MNTSAPQSIAAIYQTFQKNIPTHNHFPKAQFLSTLHQIIPATQVKIKKVFTRKKRIFIELNSPFLKKNIQLNRSQLLKHFNEKIKNTVYEKYLLEDILCL